MDLRELKPRVARTRIDAANGEAVVGTAFLVGDEHLITCLHCLDQGDGTYAHEVALQFTDWERGGERRARRVWVHPEGWDLALLRLVEPAPEVGGLPLAAGAVDDERFVSWGYPSPAPAGEHVSGRVVDHSYRYKGRGFLHLKSDEARDPLGGLSGAPVVVDGDVVVGVVSAQLMAPGVEGWSPPQPRFNSLYAIPIERLRREPTQSRTPLVFRGGEEAHEPAPWLPTFVERSTSREASAKLTSRDLLRVLSKVNEGQLSRLLLRLEIPSSEHPSRYKTREEQVLELIERIEQHDNGLQRLERVAREELPHLFPSR